MSELTSLDEFQEAVSEHGRTVVLFTSPSWCPPCRQFEPQWNRAVQLSTGDGDGYNFHRVVELEQNVWQADLGVQSQPTVLVYEDGQPVKTIIGARSALPFLREIRELN